MVNRVVAALDFSGNSWLALQRAAELAGLYRVPLTAVHVAEGPSLASYSTYASMGDPAWFMDARPDAKGSMDSWLAHYPGAEGLILPGSPARAILGAVGPETLLVVGHLRHDTLENLLFGSTATRLARRAPCDLMIVKGGQEPERVPRPNGVRVSCG